MHLISAVDKDSSCNNTMLPSPDTCASFFLSLEPNQSAARQERRNLGRPSCCNCAQILSIINSPPEAPRYSSRPSRNSVFPRQSDKSKQLTKLPMLRYSAFSPSACMALASSSNKQVLPAPGSARSTHAVWSRNTLIPSAIVAVSLSWLPSLVTRRGTNKLARSKAMIYQSSKATISQERKEIRPMGFLLRRRCIFWHWRTSLQTRRVPLDGHSWCRS